MTTSDSSSDSDTPLVAKRQRSVPVSSKKLGPALPESATFCPQHARALLVGTDMNGEDVYLYVKTNRGIVRSNFFNPEGIRIPNPAGRDSDLKWHEPFRFKNFPKVQNDKKAQRRSQRKYILKIINKYHPQGNSDGRDVDLDTAGGYDQGNAQSSAAPRRYGPARQPSEDLLSGLRMDKVGSSHSALKTSGRGSDQQCKSNDVVDGLWAQLGSTTDRTNTIHADHVINNHPGRRVAKSSTSTLPTTLKRADLKHALYSRAESVCIRESRCMSRKEMDSHVIPVLAVAESSRRRSGRDPSPDAQAPESKRARTIASPATAPLSRIYGNQRMTYDTPPTDRRELQTHRSFSELYFVSSRPIESRTPPPDTTSYPRQSSSFIKTEPFDFPSAPAIEGLSMDVIQSTILLVTIEGQHRAHKTIPLARCQSLDQLFSTIINKLHVSDKKATRFREISAFYQWGYDEKHLIDRADQDDWMLFCQHIWKAWEIDAEKFREGNCKIKLLAHIESEYDD